MLTLPIKKKWFDLILYNIKKEEYREIKPYYTTRFSKLFNIDEKALIKLTKQTNRMDLLETREIRFRNGYASTSPSFVAAVSLSIGTGNANWGAIPGKRYYILHISEITERTGIQ